MTFYVYMCASLLGANQKAFHAKESNLSRSAEPGPEKEWKRSLTVPTGTFS